MVDQQRSGRATIAKFLGIASTAPRLDQKASLTLSARSIARSPPTESFGGCVPVTHPFIVVPIIADAGERATRRFLEFFAATIGNRNTRAAYMVAAAGSSAGVSI